jgi:hypothetical protein
MFRLIAGHQPHIRRSQKPHNQPIFSSTAAHSSVLPVHKAAHKQSPPGRVSVAHIHQSHVRRYRRKFISVAAHRPRIGAHMPHIEIRLAASRSLMQRTSKAISRTSKSTRIPAVITPDRTDPQTAYPPLSLQTGTVPLAGTAPWPEIRRYPQSSGRDGPSGGSLLRALDVPFLHQLAAARAKERRYRAAPMVLAL